MTSRHLKACLRFPRCCRSHRLSPSSSQMSRCDAVTNTLLRQVIRLSVARTALRYTGGKKTRRLQTWADNSALILLENTKLNFQFSTYAQCLVIFLHTRLPRRLRHGGVVFPGFGETRLGPRQRVLSQPEAGISQTGRPFMIPDGVLAASGARPSAALPPAFSPAALRPRRLRAKRRLAQRCQQRAQALPPIGCILAVKTCEEIRRWRNADGSEV